LNRLKLIHFTCCDLRDDASSVGIEDGWSKEEIYNGVLHG
jgi:hypothetical protein